MKNILKLFYVPVVLVSIMMIAGSCSKDESIATVVEEEMAPGEIAMKEPEPGIYQITKFIDTGDDETAQFNNYLFEFQADGDFIAVKSNGTTFNGSWDLNSAETIMTLNIAGNEALDDLDDDDWKVVKITNQKIKIRANGPDIVIFQKI